MTLLSRLAALGILLLLLAALWLYVGLPIAGQVASDRQELAARQAMALHLKALIVAEPEMRRQLATTGSAPARRDHLLPGSSEAQASALLQERLKRVLAEHGATLVSLQALAVRPAGDLKRVGLRIEFGAETAALQKVLYAIESGQPVLVVDNLYVRTRGSEFRAAANPLDVTIEIGGYMAAAGAS